MAAAVGGEATAASAVSIGSVSFTAGEWFILQNTLSAGLKASAQRGNFFTNFLKNYTNDLPISMVFSLLDVFMPRVFPESAKFYTTTLRPILYVVGTISFVQTLKEVGCGEEGGWRGSDICK
jgi:hypothetical protein